MMTVQEFIVKWRQAELKERSAAQEHFLDLCNVLGHPTPAAADPTGDHFCFERGVSKHGGGEGFADVWKRGFFGWEYKGKHKDLSAAYDQLLRYRNALENPPLLVVCDLDRIIVHTNFTGTVSAVHEIPLEALGEPRNIEILRAVFENPGALRPGRTSVAVTRDAARHLAEIAAILRGRGLDPAAVAHFLDRVVFCLFAEDVGLLPDMVFTRLLEKTGRDPERFTKQLGHLFDAMAAGGDFGLESVRRFNGNLFDDRTVLDLTAEDIARIAAAAKLDWSAVDPSIFGTLFERGLDPATRTQLGAHFTSRADIELVVDAVVMTPLRRDWDACREKILALLAPARESKVPGAWKKAQAKAEALLHDFLDRLRGVKILDPACGSGNFLYVALLRLKDLEKEAAVEFPSENGLNPFLPGVDPAQLYGIEINPYAHDLAQMTVWIGWLQWIRANGFGFPDDPVLRPLSGNIRRMDAIVAPDGTEPEWPQVDFIIGNPPFIGGSRLWEKLGRDQQERLWSLYKDRVPGSADFCCYWFEKARAHIAAGKCRRAGLLATQGIRGGTNREVLKRIKESGDIFWAESDRPWILDGANVHVSMVGFDCGEELSKVLDGKPVGDINANLTSCANLTEAVALPEQKGIAFIGTKKAGKFELSDAEALEMLGTPNPHGRPNSDVLRPWMDGFAVTKRPSFEWIIDCGTDMPHDLFSLYAEPYDRILRLVKPDRDKNNRKAYREKWWLHAEARPGMRKNCRELVRYLATVRHAKHRIFCWADNVALPDDGVFAFARSDDYFFGVLHSRFHEVWALAQGTQLETRPRYTPTTCFETFPFPEADAGQRAAIGAAAAELHTLREGWLNPPEWTRTETLVFPGTVGGPWDRYIDPATAEDRGGFQVGTVRYPRIVARDADCAARLRVRTLTNLYNARPAWLAACHAKLDAAVAAAYGWPADLPEEDLLARLLALNLARAAG
ncbi:MAG TPA: N-6 DNA methylase [Candidatus Hydrogenedentes bacterium]|nr:N-6 DNA methylase [Candidatus Hydrogenedentota bacterium]